MLTDVHPLLYIPRVEFAFFLSSSVKPYRVQWVLIPSLIAWISVVKWNGVMHILYVRPNLIKKGNLSRTGSVCFEGNVSLQYSETTYVSQTNWLLWQSLEIKFICLIWILNAHIGIDHHVHLIFSTSLFVRIKLKMHVLVKSRTNYWFCIMPMNVFMYQILRPMLSY